jgi:hypothetical protein
MAEDLLLPLFLPLFVLAVILSEGRSPKSKDPEELNSPLPSEPFNPNPFPSFCILLSSPPTQHGHSDPERSRMGKNPAFAFILSVQVGFCLCRCSFLIRVIRENPC